MLLLLNPSNTIQLHYWFGDSSHEMNAFVQNKCEYEFLGIIKEISNHFGCEVIIETSPLTEGGLQRWFKVLSKTENSKAIITTAVITSIATQIFINPLGKLSEKFIEKIFEDKEKIAQEESIRSKEEEKLDLEIRELKSKSLKNLDTLSSNNLLKKKRSNYYEALEKYPKVIKVSFNHTNSNFEIIQGEVNRNEFQKYILATDDLPSIKVDNAIIEIISPVLKKGKYKWMGIYNGESIPFNMKSVEYKIMIQSGEIKFVNGTSINCLLEIRRKIDSEGVEKIVSYDVLRVNSYFENEKPIETPEGKKHRKAKERSEKQLKLFNEE
ncbi:hypothetical protein [Lacihabitans lacunae]|uniref:Uncharacterized protein n=1 Tax=Lacihabitans lacunae TaxID=1028214 RepID=A0ABV7Z4I3_9BACT